MNKVNLNKRVKSSKELISHLRAKKTVSVSRSITDSQRLTLSDHYRKLYNQEKADIQRLIVNTKELVAD
ncbi:hypothetical protein [Fibrella aquatica]|uniref:hypothetical protein n=1 Tax=Fibrella aquatica TaxID=3242487 RepID=UPI00351FD0B5